MKIHQSYLDTILPFQLKSFGMRGSRDAVFNFLYMLANTIPMNYDEDLWLWKLEKERN